MKKIELKVVVIILVVFCLYFFIASAPYFSPPSVPDDFAVSFSAEDYYSDDLGVDRALPIDDRTMRFNEILRAIESAEYNLDVVFFFIYEGESTDVICGALFNAAERGVKVRLLIDGLKFGFSKAACSALAHHPNISLALYNPLNILQPTKMHSRLHDKFIIVDNKLLLMCGGNLGDAYFSPDGHNGKITMDRLTLVYNTECKSSDKSSVIFAVREYMESLWTSPYCRAFSGRYSSTAKQLVKIYETAYNTAKRIYGDDFKAGDYDYYSATLATNKITFMASPFDTEVKEPLIEYIFIGLMDAALESVVMETPYLIADDSFNKLFARMENNGVSCTLLSSSIRGVSKADILLFSVYRAERNKLLDYAINIYEHQSDDYKHIKTYIIDERLTLVGSYNLCHHSYSIDAETVLAIDSAEFASLVQERIDTYQNESALLNVDSIKPYESFKPFSALWWKKVLIKILGIVLKPLRKLF